MRKIFTFICAALMSVSMFANLVTIGSYEFTEGDGQSIVKEDITFEYNYMVGDLAGDLKCPEGFEITQVEVSGSNLFYLNIGWNDANPWQGSSESVYIECQFGEDITIFCTYAEAAPNKPTISGEDMFSESTTVTIASSTAGATIYYTIDGSNPTEGEKLVYSDPFTLTESATVKAAAYKNGQYSTITTKNFIKLTPAPVGPNYVVWDTEFLSNIYCGLKMSTPPVLVNENNVKDGITCVFSGTQAGNSLANNREFYLSAADSKLTFSHESRNITKIEIYGQGGHTCRDWAWDATNFKLVWEGTPAAVVDLQGPESGSLDVYQIYQIVFTLEDGGGEPAATEVIITDSDFPGGDSFTKDGVTISAEMIDDMYGNISGPGSFSTTLGNFTKIEVNATYIGSLGEGWSGDSEHKTWTGNASSVSFSGDINGDEEGVTLKFTIEATTPTAVENVQTNQVQATKFFRDGMLLIEKNGKIYNVMGTEVK